MGASEKGFLYQRVGFGLLLATISLGKGDSVALSFGSCFNSDR